MMETRIARFFRAATVTVSDGATHPIQSHHRCEAVEFHRFGPAVTMLLLDLLDKRKPDHFELDPRLVGRIHLPTRDLEITDQGSWFQIQTSCVLIDIMPSPGDVVVRDPYFSMVGTAGQRGILNEIATNRIIVAELRLHMDSLSMADDPYWTTLAQMCDDITAATAKLEGKLSRSA